MRDIFLLHQINVMRKNECTMLHNVEVLLNRLRSVQGDNPDSRQELIDQIEDQLLMFSINAE